MKKLLWLVLLIALVGAAHGSECTSNDCKVYVNHLILNEVQSGFMTGYLDLENVGDADINRMRITVSVPELGIRSRVGPFDLEQGDYYTRSLYMEVPSYVQPGAYLARITFSSTEGGFREVKHRYLFVE